MQNLFYLNCFGFYAQNLELTDLDEGDDVIVSLPHINLKRWRPGNILLRFLTIHSTIEMQLPFKNRVLFNKFYSGDLNSKLVWYSNGPKQFAP